MADHKDNRKAQKPPLNSWPETIGEILGLIIWTIVAVFGAQFIVGLPLYWAFGVEFLNSTVGNLIYSALSYTVGATILIVVPVLVKQFFKNRKKQTASKKLKASSGVATRRPLLFDRVSLGLKGWPTWTDIGLAVVGYFVYMIAAFGLVSLFSLFPWFDLEQTQEIGFSTTIFGLERIMAFVALVIIAPIAEELIFRGWLYDKLRVSTTKKFSEIASIIISALLTSILFGAFHMQWNVGVNVFAMSLVMCGMREVTGTIYSGILLHIIKNGVAFYLLFVLGF